MTFDPGDLVLVPFPFSDLKATKHRPAIILSNRSFNQGGDVVVCAVTSNLRDAAYSVLIEQEDLATGKLPKPSRVKAAKVATLAQTLVRKRLGALRPATLENVLKELRASLA